MARSDSVYRTSSVWTRLDYYDESGLEERWVCCWIQYGRTRLERLEEPANVPTESKIIAEQDLLILRTGSRPGHS